MVREPNDAWRQIAPLDRLAAALDALPAKEPEDRRRTVRFEMYVKGTEAIFVCQGSGEEVEAKFRFNRRAGQWQMFRREGSRWIAEGPPGERAGRLLEKLVLVMQGADPSAVFPEAGSGRIKVPSYGDGQGEGHPHAR